MRAAAAARLGPAFLLALMATACGSSGSAAPSDAGHPALFDGADDVIVQVDSGCGSTLTDPHNCGGCGIDCEGGVCVEGVCSPLPPGVLASGLPTPIGIVIDDANVYWMSLGTSSGTTSQLMKCAKKGCGNAPTVLATGGWESSTRLALDNGTIYWATPNAVLSCPSTGCPAGPTLIASGALQPTDVAVGTGGIYVGDSLQFALLMYPFADAGMNPTVLWHSPAAPSAIAASGSDVYLATTGLSLISCATSPCTTVVRGGMPTALNIHGSGIYIGARASASPGAVGWCNAADCASTFTILTDKITYCEGVAGDGTSVYFTDRGFAADATGSFASGLGRVAKCPTTGCTGAPTPVEGYVNFPQQIAVDDAAVYWTDFGSSNDPNGTKDGRVMTSAK